MARTWISGMETGSVPAELAGWGTTHLVGTTTFDTGVFRTGARSLKVAPATDIASYAWFGPQTFQRAYLRFYLRITTLPASSAAPIFGNNNTNTGLILSLNTSGTIGLRAGTTLLGTSTTALTDTSRWYLIEVKGIASTDLELKIDGVAEVSGSSAGGHDGYYRIFGGIGGGSLTTRAMTIYFDDICEDDAAYPSAGAVALLVPTAQNSVTASTWQKPGGAVTNMHTSIDNVPPVGLIDSTSSAQAENFIRDAVNNASADVVLAMTTYSAAGIVASDTINSVQAFALTAAPSGTSPANGSLETTNPAQAEVNFGTFYHGSVTGGTFPTGWKRVNHTLTATPTPTLGSAPTLEIGKRTASTRIGQVCFAGIYVDYAPAVSTSVPTGARQIPQLLAH